MLDGELLIELAVQDFEVLDEATKKKYIVRSLTRAESAELQIPKAKLGCTVSYFEDARGKKLGYRAYTHRCCTNFYDEPGDIPAGKLKFVSSTA